MNAVDILLIVLLLAAAAFAVRGILRRKKQGCGCGCSACPASCARREKRE